MVAKLFKDAYLNLITENKKRILLEMKESPERDHIVGILDDSVNFYYIKTAKTNE